MNRNSQRLFLIGVVISLLFHASSLITIWFKAPRKVDSTGPIEITVIDPNAKKNDKSQETSLNGQLVEQNEKSVNDDKPKDAKFLSKNNQTVLKQTRALQTGKFKNDGGLGSAAKAAPKSQTRVEKNEKQAKADDIGDEGLKPLHKFTPQYNWNKAVQAETENDKNTGSGNDRSVSQSDDYTPDVEKGLQTMLSTREFVYYSYYSRIKQRLNQYWEPKIKEKVVRIFKQGRHIATSHDHITKLLIVLNEKGKLVTIKVLGNSGEEELDSAAIEAFQQAAPFPNPPVGIVEKDGTIKIRWDFVLEV